MVFCNTWDFRSYEARSAPKTCPWKLGGCCNNCWRHPAVHHGQLHLEIPLFPRSICAKIPGGFHGFKKNPSRVSIIGGFKPIQTYSSIFFFHLLAASYQALPHRKRTRGYPTGQTKGKSPEHMLIKLNHPPRLGWKLTKIFETTYHLGIWMGVCGNLLSL